MNLNKNLDLSLQILTTRLDQYLGAVFGSKAVDCNVIHEFELCNRITFTIKKAQLKSQFVHSLSPLVFPITLREIELMRLCTRFNRFFTAVLFFAPHTYQLGLFMMDLTCLVAKIANHSKPTETYEGTLLVKNHQ